MGVASDIVLGGWNLLRGLGVTFRNLLRPAVTLQYPEERHPLPAGYRGLPALLEDPETGKLKCVGCGVCARNCPIRIITVSSRAGDDGKKTVDQYSIDISRCMICGLCVESCPFGAMTMSDHFELATANKASLLFDRERLRLSNLEAEKVAADRGLRKNGSHKRPPARF